MPLSPNQTMTGLFIPTTNLWDPTIILQSNTLTPELKELFVALYQNLNIMAQAINLKESAYYIEEEFVTSQMFFPNPVQITTPSYTNYRAAYRYVRNFGALPNTGTTSVAHGLDLSNATPTRLYGAAYNSGRTSFIPLPYASPTLANNISLEITDTDIVIITGSNRSDYEAIVVFEYLKD